MSPLPGGLRGNRADNPHHVNRRQVQEMYDLATYLRQSPDRKPNSKFVCEPLTRLIDPRMSNSCVGLRCVDRIARDGTLRRGAAPRHAC